MFYSFDVDLAKKYGVDEAIMIHNFQFWIVKNRTNRKHFYDGRTWTYNSIEAFQKLFSFWTKRQIERILGRLIKENILLKGNFNKNSYDRTNWYAFAQESLYLPISPNGEMHYHETVEPIPDIKPDTYISSSFKSSRKTGGGLWGKRKTPPFPL